jgi:hypothetical protein
LPNTIVLSPLSGETLVDNPKYLWFSIGIPILDVTP